MQKKTRRSVRQRIADKFYTWLAQKTQLKIYLERQWYLAAFRQGAATIVEKPVDMSTQEYRDMLTAQAIPAYERFMTEQASGATSRLIGYDTPPSYSAVWGPLPPPQPTPAAPSTVQILPADSLRRMIGTSHLPAVRLPGAVFEKHLETTGKHRTKSLRDIAAANAFQASTTRPVRLTRDQQRAYDAYEQGRVDEQQKRAQ